MSNIDSTERLQQTKLSAKLMHVHQAESDQSLAQPVTRMIDSMPE